MDSHLITGERNDSHLIIRINRPEKFNALSREMIFTLSDIFTGLDNEGSLRAVILTGNGDNSFCAGIDLTDLAESNERELSKLSQALFSQIENCHLPVIAAVNGIAAGDGCELALACHLRIASANAQLSMPEAISGIVPADGRQRLERRVGEEGALELLSGKAVSAEESLRLGLINRVVPAVELLARAEDLAREIAQLAPLAIRACLEAVTQGNQLPLAEGLELEARLFASLFDTDDVREGTSAFLEKRAPVFKGT
jgi:enoyl-CoA hydratase